MGGEVYGNDDVLDGRSEVLCDKRGGKNRDKNLYHSNKKFIFAFISI